MFVTRTLASLRSTTFLLGGCGLLLGALVPCSAALLFGKEAFAPLFVICWLLVGVSAGVCSSLFARKALRLHLEEEGERLRQLTGEAEAPRRDAGSLQSLMESYDAGLGKALSVTSATASLVAEASPLCERLQDTSQRIIRGNEQQAAKEKETLHAMEEMNAFFNDVLKEIEDLSVRTDERASISTQMSATNDAIAGNIREYSTSVLETSVSIEEMAVSIRETAANIEALAAFTEQTSSSIGQISTAIVNVRDNAQLTAEHSEKVRLQAGEGITSMAATIDAMHEIEGTSRDSFSAIKRLALHTARVGEFLNIIKDVVAQTNLLSLNASIIAAQAGEQGKSFAVVAEEVRNLAHRTSASTKEIEDLVKNIQEETSAVERAVTVGKEKVAVGVGISARADEALHRIEESAAEASRMVQKIALATVEQAAGSKLITEETQKNLERVQQVTKAIQEQERGIGQIVRTLEHMRALSQKITVSTEEQARGNRLYLKSVMEDNEKVKELRDTSIQQIMMGDVVLNFVREAAALIETNTAEAREILSGVEMLARLADRLQGGGPAPSP